MATERTEENRGEPRKTEEKREREKTLKKLKCGKNPELSMWQHKTQNGKAK